MNLEKRFCLLFIFASSFLFLLHCGKSSHNQDYSQENLQNSQRIYGFWDFEGDQTEGLPLPPDMEGFVYYVPQQLDPPSDLECVAESSRQVYCTWTDNSDNETMFMLYRRLAEATGELPVLVGTILTDNTQIRDVNGLEPNTSYSYFVLASSNGGRSPFSNSSDATTFPLAVAAPSPPYLWVPEVLSHEMISLSWSHYSNDPLDSETGYNIFRKTGASGDYGLVQTALANEDVRLDYYLLANTTYCYRIQAYNEIGESPYSNERCVTTPAQLLPPGPPVNLNIYVVNQSQLDLSWQRNSQGGIETRFEIYRKGPGQSSHNYYAQVDSGVFYYSDLSCLPSSTYTYRIKAINAQGSALSDEISGITMNPPIPSFINLKTVPQWGGHDGHIRWQNSAVDNQNSIRVSNRKLYSWQTRAFLRFNAVDGSGNPLPVEHIYWAFLYVPRHGTQFSPYDNLVQVYKCGDYLADGQFTISDFYPSSSQYIGYLDWDQINVTGFITPGYNCFMLKVAQEGPSGNSAWHYFGSYENSDPYKQPWLRLNFLTQ